MAMRVYSTPKGEEVCKEVIENGYAWARTVLSLIEDELDNLRTMCDPIFGTDKLRGDEVAEEDYPIWRKLAGLGYVRVEEY